MNAAGTRTPRIAAVLREEERVRPLELFFDLVFVLALTQCTALMAAVPSWEGVAQALLILAVLWWSWGGYAWLTSVLDPEEGAVRLVMFVAMAAFLVAALAVPRAFDDGALVFAAAYAVVRAAHILLFVIASRDDPELRQSVTALGVSTAIAVGILLAAAATDDVLQGALWSLAIVLDYGGPALFGVGGWKIMPEHFAERYGLIILIALGESIVAIGAGVTGQVDIGIVAAAVLGIAVAAALWWLYFDVVSIVAAVRLGRATSGSERNALARDSYSYLHLPMVVGIVLIALGMKKTLGDVDEPLKLVPAVAMLGGASFYLLAHVAFRLRNIRTLNKQRLITAVVVAAFIPVALEMPALAMVGILAVLLAIPIAYETFFLADLRARIRHDLVRETRSD